MIEVNISYDLLQDMDQQAYQKWAKKTVDLLFQSPGLVEFRAKRNELGSPQVQATSVWQTAADLANFSKSVEWQGYETEMRAFVNNKCVKLW